MSYWRLPDLTPHIRCLEVSILGITDSGLVLFFFRDWTSFSKLSLGQSKLLTNESLLMNSGESTSCGSPADGGSSRSVITTCIFEY